MPPLSNKNCFRLNGSVMRQIPILSGKELKGPSGHNKPQTRAFVRPVKPGDGWVCKRDHPYSVQCSTLREQDFNSELLEAGIADWRNSLRALAAQALSERRRAGTSLSVLLSLSRSLSSQRPRTLLFVWTTLIPSTREQMP